MLIICTKDNDIVEWTNNPRSGADRWRHTVVLDRRYDQNQATEALGRALAGSNAGEALCFSAHGNDDEIGDAGDGPNDWAWNRQDIAELLKAHAPGAGPILIHACAEQVSNFSAGLAVALQGIHALNNVWVYGYNRPIDATTPYPEPAGLARQADLQGTQVMY